ncbi:MAG: 50S ribosomal protein L9 [Rickettsiales bacterium]|nr:50S ribosomal protein L9 [Rickettsiales bacterium]
MEIILLERIARLGAVGDVVSVKNGFARNYLIPEGKALLASKENKADFEAQRAQFEKQNAERRSEAEAEAKKLEGQMVTVIRQASDDGKLYGSVAVRDVADALTEAGHEIDRRLIDLNAAIKSLGLYDVTVNLHPEVPVTIKVHVARNADSPIPQELLEEEAVEEAPAVEAADAEAPEEVEAAADEAPAEVAEEAAEEEKKEAADESAA